MPSFEQAGAKDDEIWSIVAFLKKLPGVSESRLQGLDGVSEQAVLPPLLSNKSCSFAIAGGAWRASADSDDAVPAMPASTAQ